MDRIMTVAQLIVPIFAVLMLGMLARKNQMMKPEEIRGLQKFVVKFDAFSIARLCVFFKKGRVSFTVNLHFIRKKTENRITPKTST